MGSATRRRSPRSQLRASVAATRTPHRFHYDQETCQLLKDLKVEVELQQKCANSLLTGTVEGDDIEQSELIFGQEFCLTSTQFCFRRPNRRQVMPLAELLEQNMDPEPPPFSCFDALFSGLRSEPLQTKENVPVDENIKKQNEKYFTTSALHLACTLPNSCHWIKQLCAKGAKVNEQNIQGQTPLHVVLLGDVKSNGDNIKESVKCLLSNGANVNLKDSEGETPLLYIRTFLEEGTFELAEEIMQLLLKYGSNPNIRDTDGRTLLTYCVYYLDQCTSISRLLLNNGGCVWNDGNRCQQNDDICMENSAFAWFLKAIIRQRKVDNCSEILCLLSHVMAVQPKRMHAHVLRTMFKHVRCYRILGPVFLQLKMAMTKYWTEPHDLKFLCWTAIRQSNRRISRSVPYLGLPKSLRNYVLMK